MDFSYSYAADKEIDHMNIYCVFCLTGKEESIKAALKRNNVSCISAFSKRIVVKRGLKLQETRQLLPGYVMFAAKNLSEDILDNLRHHPDYLKMLNYTNGYYELQGRDLEFVNWLTARGGLIDVSRVYRQGDRIKVLDGPLKDYEGCIVQVNMKRRCVAICVGDGSIFNKIWCSIELIDGADPNEHSADAKGID